jgi:BirA family biotin operon repressor/biotin-[acetyl-CoA-carboxylase] ligase
VNEKRKQLLSILLKNKGKYVSGEEISQRLQISRTAIWKHVHELKKDGYQIEGLRKQGYRLLEASESLQPSSLTPFLQSTWLGHQIHLFEETASTQLEAHQLARLQAPSGTIVLAEQQTQGKGRLGRPWFSPKGSGIWMSMIIRPQIPLSHVPQLTLLTAVAVLKAVHKATGVKLGIKWPNDLLFEARKVAGILTEVNAEPDLVHYVIIGIGMNANQEEKDFTPDIQHIATSLRLAAGKKVSRKALILHILEEWESLYELWLEHGFTIIKTLWESHSVSLGRFVTARTVNGELAGFARGITDEGVLLLEDEQGQVHKIYSADIETP